MIDLTRWQELLDALASARDGGVPFQRLQEAQKRWVQENSNLELHRSRGPRGKPDPRRPDLAAVFARDIVELEARLASAAHEVKRIETVQAEAGAKLAVLQGLVDSIWAWAAAQSPPVMLPGAQQLEMQGFAATSLHIQTQPNARALP